MIPNKEDNKYGILKDTERQVIIDFISNRCPDELLLYFAERLKDHRADLTNSRSSMVKYLGTGAPVQPVPAPVVAAPVEPVIAKVASVVPPGQAASRITSKTEELIYRTLESPKTFDQLCSALGGSKKNTESALKLLWQRGKLEFDGSKFSKKGGIE